MMLTDQRQHLHEICAAWYEQHFRNSMTYVSLITHHWLRSACAPKKVHYLQRAAHHAKETFSNEEAIQHLSALVALAFGKDTATAQLVSLRRYWDTGVHVVPAAVAAAATAAASPQHQQQQHGGSVLTGSATIAPELAATAAAATASVARSGSTAAVVPVTAAVCDSTSGTATATPTPTSAATATASAAVSPTTGSSA
eukprot:5228-Heterococcus_DN1.PRE.1